MRKLRVTAVLLTVALAVPLSASQFMKIPFDKVVRDSQIIVHGVVGPVSSSWDSNGEIIFSRTNIEVQRYIAGAGPGLLPVREVGGTVDGYTQQAIGFPELREGEEVVLILRRWDDSSEYRIHAYAQGKFVVQRGRVLPDEGLQGEDRRNTMKRADDDTAGYALDEFEQMIEAALVGDAASLKPMK